MTSNRAIKEKRIRKWRHSLYARAALFLALGSGSLVGAVAVLSSDMVDEMVERLLEERIDLARAAGIFLEAQVRGDMEHVVERLRPVVGREGTLEPGPLREALAQEYRVGLFSEGAFVLDAEGAFVAAVPDGAGDLRESVDMAALTALARTRNDIVSAPLVRVGPRYLLVVLRPLRSAGGQLIGFVGGLVQPAATNVLYPLRRADEQEQAELDLVDGAGVVVASTDRRDLFRRGDHGNLLATAISDQRELQGRCHSCHEDGDAPTERGTDVLAFAPLPNLGLGLAVRQPESEALAPAFALQRRLVLLGFSFVALFVVFAGLSVRSVVHPVTRLTAAVRRAESTQERLSLPAGGRDEVGELSRALNLWRSRMLDSLDAAEQHRRALYREMEATQRHLRVLDDIVADSTSGADLRSIVEHALERALELAGVSSGIIGLCDPDHDFYVSRGTSSENAGCLLDLCRGHLGEREASVIPGLAGPYPTVFADLSESRGLCDPSLSTIVAVSVRGARGLVLTAVLADPQPREVEKRRLNSLLRHLALSVTSRLLREADLERQEHQRLYLHRVLKAQEDERRRVARELHDTLAQDLAALRLEIERLSNRADEEEVRAKLEEFEGRTRDTLVTVRRILLDLRLSVLESMGFLPALQWHLERVQRLDGIRTMLVVDGDEVDLDYEMSVTLFRILQESLLNVAQHAGAEHVFVTVTYGHDDVELTIEDDGRGFDPDRVRHQHLEGEDRGLGLLGMEERARLLGGTMHISSSPGEGTTIRVSVPLRDTDSLRPMPNAREDAS